MSLTLRNGVFHFRKMVSGHMINRSTKTGDRKLAQQIAATWEAEAIRDIVLAKSSPITLPRLITQYLDSRAGTAGHKNAKMHLEKFASLGPKSIQSISSSDPLGIVAQQRALGRKPSTLAVMTNYWNSLMQFAKDRGFTPGPRLEGIKGVEGRVRFLSLEEEIALLNAVDPRTPYHGKSAHTDEDKQNNWDLIVMLLELGCRYSEAANLHWSQVDLGSRTVVVRRGKKGKRSTLFIPKRLSAVLERRRRDALDEYVFPTKRGRHNETHWMQAAVKRAQINTDLGSVSLHTLRHTAANRWLMAGLSLPEVQQMLGHANITTTMIYLHVNPTDTARKAASIMDEYSERVPSTFPSSMA